jgi:hypothetical protein
MAASFSGVTALDLGLMANVLLQWGQAIVEMIMLTLSV